LRETQQSGDESCGTDFPGGQQAETDRQECHPHSPRHFFNLLLGLCVSLQMPHPNGTNLKPEISDVEIPWLKLTQYRPKPEFTVRQRQTGDSPWRRSFHMKLRVVLMEPSSWIARPRDVWRRFTQRCSELDSINYPARVNEPNPSAQCRNAAMGACKYDQFVLRVRLTKSAGCSRLPA
jgi:hypothetical protein